MSHDCKCSPDSEYRFFLYHPNGNGMEFFRTAEARDAAAEDAIDSELDDGWSEDVRDIVAGEVTAHTVARDVEQKPKRAEFESDEAFDEALEEWGNTDHDYRCRYELAPLDDDGEWTP